MTQAGGARRRGRRPAGEDARGAIVAAARAEFASRGYDGTTLRGIARAAGVDPRLVHHYFEGKEDVFVAAFSIPVRPAEAVGRILAAGVDGLGERLVRLFFQIWEPPSGRETITGILRLAAGGEQGAAMLRQFLGQVLFSRIAATIGGDDPELRAGLVASHMVGVAIMRYVVRLEPVASADVEDLVPLLAPTMQRYLDGDLPGTVVGGPG